MSKSTSYVQVLYSLKGQFNLSYEFREEYKRITGKDLAFHFDFMRYDDTVIQIYKSHTPEWCSHYCELATIFVPRVFLRYITISPDPLTLMDEENYGEIVKVNHSMAYADLLHKFMAEEIDKTELEKAYNALYDAEHQPYDAFRFSASLG